MSDAEVAALLRSDEPLVVIEAPAGCGKTHQGANYAKAVVATLRQGRLLVLAHTHAACGEFRSRTQAHSSKVEVKTVASLATEIVSVYHIALGVPPNADTWAWKNNGAGFDEVAQKCAELVTRHPMIGNALARRYPFVICDEHQDCTPNQHAILMALLGGGAKLRIFADPMQRIYNGTTAREAKADEERWTQLKNQGKFAKLDVPHRWSKGSQELGAWILEARDALMNGQQIIVPARRPLGLNVIVADNCAKARTQFQLDQTQRKPVDNLMMSGDQMLVLTGRNDMVDALTAFTNRRVGVWEGHTREKLATLVEALQSANDDAEVVGTAVVAFAGGVGAGFSPSSHGNRLVQEIRDGCTKPRKGKPAAIQAMARHVLDEPNHIGVARSLKLLSGYIEKKLAGFDQVRIDYRAEFADAIRLEAFATPEDGHSELARRRTYFQRSLPPRTVSTIHKAKGLECANVMLIPCDKTFTNTAYSRCRLYVALSRASQTLTLVVPSSDGSPLLKIE